MCRRQPFDASLSQQRFSSSPKEWEAQFTPPARKERQETWAVMHIYDPRAPSGGRRGHSRKRSAREVALAHDSHFVFRTVAFPYMHCDQNSRLQEMAARAGAHTLGGARTQELWARTHWRTQESLTAGRRRMLFGRKRTHSHTHAERRHAHWGARAHTQARTPVRRLRYTHARRAHAQVHACTPSARARRHAQSNACTGTHRKV